MRLASQNNVHAHPLTRPGKIIRLGTRASSLTGTRQPKEPLDQDDGDKNSIRTFSSSAWVIA